MINFESIFLLKFDKDFVNALTELAKQIEKVFDCSVELDSKNEEFKFRLNKFNIMISIPYQRILGIYIKNYKLYGRESKCFREEYTVEGMTKEMSRYLADMCKHTILKEVGEE